jgi:hypothetical protein
MMFLSTPVSARILLPVKISSQVACFPIPTLIAIFEKVED